MSDMDPTRRRVLVTDGNNRAALAVTRSLGRRGHHVVVGEAGGRALAQASRYCSTAVTYPDPARQPQAFVEWLAATVVSERIDVVLPVADIATVLVVENRQAIDPKVRIPFSTAHAINRAADKSCLVRLANELGVPAPATVVLDHPSRVQECAARVNFPLVIKPHRSRVRTEDGWAQASVRYARDMTGLERDLASRRVHEFPVLLQEYIPGYGLGVFACCDRGRPVALFSHRRLREKPPTGGVSVLSESIKVPPLAQAYAEALLGALGWHGVAMVEFKIDARDAKPRLMEINGRFWGSLQLAIDAGVDFPAILLDLADGHAPATPPAYREGVRSRWLWGDVDSLMISLRNGPPNGRGRLGLVMDFAKLWQRDLHYENPRWADLRPWFFETARWIRRAV